MHLALEQGAGPPPSGAKFPIGAIVVLEERIVSAAGNRHGLRLRSDGPRGNHCASARRLRRSAIIALTPPGAALT